MIQNSSETLPPREAAKYVGLAPATLAKIRCVSNDGPRYIKLGRKVLYRRSDLDDWLDQRMARSTTDADQRLPSRLTDAMPAVASNNHSK